MYSIEDIELAFNNQGIDTVSQIVSYKTLSNIIDKEGFEFKSGAKNLPINPYLKSIENQLKRDPKNRYKKDDHKPIIEYVKLARGKDLSNYMLVVRNIPLLFDHAIENKKAKGHYSLVIFSGLHQPTKHVTTGALKFISRILKRKTFKIHDIAFSKDYRDKLEVNHGRKNTFKEQLKEHGKDCISTGSSLYCNNIYDKSINKILMYDKYKKQTVYHKQEIGTMPKDWKRLEMTVKPSKKMSFLEFINSEEFAGALETFDQMAEDLGVPKTDKSYLEYQINSILDNRVMNNNESKKQFNSVDSIKRFKTSDFRRFSFAHLLIS